MLNQNVRNALEEAHEKFQAIEAVKVRSRFLDAGAFGLPNDEFTGFEVTCRRKGHRRATTLLHGAFDREGRMVAHEYGR